MDKNLELAVATVDKLYGKNTIVRLGSDNIVPVPVISTQNIALDAALCIGGIPRGRVTEVYGPECIDENSFIQYSVRTNGRRSNTKGGTIKRLYERFHKLPSDGDGRGKYLRTVTENAEFFTSAINDQNRIIQARIKNVIYAGKKDCFTIRTAKGYEITVSKEHEFFNGTVFVTLSDLEIGSTIFIHNNTPFTVKKPRNSKENRVYLYVKYHPVAGIKKVRVIINRTTREKGQYSYHRLARARAVIEANLNGLTLGEFVDCLNSNQISGLKFLTRDQQVHHKDENSSNDDLSNLEILTPAEHGELHAIERHNNLRFVAVSDTITELTYAGQRETYDLQMEDPYHNYIANHFVVHNSGGKTTLTLHIIAEAQKLGGEALFIDAEHAFDPAYAIKLGVNVDDLLVAQPDNGEQALSIAETMIQSKAVDIVVVDSVAALVPKAEIEGEMGQPQMGLQARLMSQALRKLTAITNKSKTALVFINQIREKIGVMFGNPETTTGGRALKFYSSIRIDIRKIQALKDGEKVYGARTRAKVVKNKLGVPFKEAEFDLIYGEGISSESSLLTLGEERGIIEKSGTWFSFHGERLGQGKENARRFLRANPEIADGIDGELRKLLFAAIKPAEDERE